MRIAYIINSLEGGGAAFPVPAIADVMRANGAEVRVLALTRLDGKALPAMRAAGLTVDIRTGGTSDHFAALRWLDHMIARDRPTHLWTSLTRATLLGQIIGWRRGIPVASWQHNAYLKPANLRLLRATRRLTRLWIGDSESVTELTRERFRLPPEKLVNWPIFAVDPAAPQAKAWWFGETLRLGSLGRLTPAKGYDLLLAAVRMLEDGGFRCPAPIEILIGGEGRERARLEEMAAGLRTAVRFVGFVDTPRDFLAGLHLYLQPSRWEGFCIAAHEAMQAGLPVLASTVGEMRLSIEPQISGLLVPPGDPRALADALVSLLRNPDHLAAMGEAACDRVNKRFSQLSFAAAGARALKRLVSGDRDGG